MNPAYMVRQLMDQYEKLYGVKGRITGLKVLNPENAPDEWEKICNTSGQSMTTAKQANTGYCPSASTGDPLIWITGVEFTPFTNESQFSHYSNFTDLLVNLYRVTSYDMILTQNDYQGTEQRFWRVWIDLNHDLDFDDASELIFDQTASNSSPSMGNIILPDSFTAKKG